MLDRTPKLDTPTFTVLSSGQGWQVRQYAPYSVCTMDLPSDGASMTDKGPGAFNSLAGYIFGKNSAKAAMKMTTPVINNPTLRTMSFVMPAQYWSQMRLLSAPLPLADGPVRLEAKAEETLAVRWFGGYCTPGETEKQAALLRSDVGKDGKWDVADGAALLVKQYNDPFQPPWKRRNEVAIAVRPRVEG